MTVSTTINKVTFIGDGISTVTPFPFAIRSGGSADIQVFLTTNGVMVQKTLGVDYTVALNTAISPNPTPVGGTVTFFVAPANGTLITLLRTMSLTQPTSLANQGTLYQPVLESMDDNQTMELQQIQELQGRAISVAVSDPAPLNLPPVAQRANLGMAFDSSGNPIAAAIPASGVISSAMAPFCSSATIAAAKALLGFGTAANENVGAGGKGIRDDGSGNLLVSQTVVSVSTNQSPDSGAHMTNFASSGTNIFTLPKLTTVFNGYELWVFCLTNTATLSPNAADNFPGAGGGVSIVLTQGQCARLIGDGVSAWMIFTGRIPGIGSTQTRQTFTSGSGTYTTPAGCRRIVVRAIAGGGGGTGNVSSGSNGGDTTFNAITAGGGKGANSVVGGAGGTGGAGAASLRIPGGKGSEAANIANLPGGSGGNGPFGGGTSGAAGATNTGAGGSGMDNSTGAGWGGGGAGEYMEIIINNPVATYSYTVGAAGAAGTGAGTVFAGAAGIIIVDEYY